MQRLLTGASPGHSYTVKSPSSFSSSVEAPESGTLGSSLCLQRSHTHKHTHKSWNRTTQTQRGREGRRGEGQGAGDRYTHGKATWTCLHRGWLTSPGKASAVSGAGSGTFEHCGPTSCPQAGTQGGAEGTWEITGIHSYLLTLLSWHSRVSAAHVPVSWLIKKTSALKG